jgi:hypothetical protein
MADSRPPWIAEADAYPSFGRLIWGPPPTDRVYMPLLNLMRSDVDLASAVVALRATSESSPDLESELRGMLGTRHWRFNLLAATAVALGYGSAEIIEAVWATFDRGSMVTPQLAVAASLRDPAFEAQARQRIVAGVSTAEHEVESSQKKVAALIALCDLRPACADWLRDVYKDEAIKIALVEDRRRDNGTNIATRWRTRITEIASRG